jgi:hypothetical protein
MLLKAPKFLTYSVSLVLAMGFFHAGHIVPGYEGGPWQVLGLLGAYLLLAAGCTVRGF